MDTQTMLISLRKQFAEVVFDRKALEALYDADPMIDHMLALEERMAAAITGLEWRRDRIAHRVYLASLATD